MKKKSQSTDLKNIFSEISSQAGGGNQEDCVSYKPVKDKTKKYKELDELRLTLEGMRRLGLPRDLIAKQAGVPVHELDAFANNKIASPYTIDNLKKWMSFSVEDAYNSRLGRFLEAIGVKTNEEKKKFLIDLSYDRPTNLFLDKLYDLFESVFAVCWPRHEMDMEEILWKSGSADFKDKAAACKLKYINEKRDEPTGIERQELGQYASLVE